MQRIRIRSKDELIRIHKTGLAIPAIFLHYFAPFIYAANMQFRLSHCLLVILVVAHLLGLITNDLRYRHEIHDLHDSIATSHGTLTRIHYGAANLQLLELHPEIWENPACSRFLKHELAFSILEHWRCQTQIDNLTQAPGYALDFTARVLVFFDFSSAIAFVSRANTQLAVYPCDPLSYSGSKQRCQESLMTGANKGVRNH